MKRFFFLMALVSLFAIVLSGCSVTNADGVDCTAQSTRCAYDAVKGHSAQPATQPEGVSAKAGNVRDDFNVYCANSEGYGDGQYTVVTGQDGTTAKVCNKSLEHNANAGYHVEVKNGRAYSVKNS